MEAADGAMWDDCEDVSPSDDKVITEFAMTAHDTEGITGIKVTFSSDFSNQSENQNENENPLNNQLQQVFEFGSMGDQPGNFKIVYDDIS